MERLTRVAFILLAGLAAVAAQAMPDPPAASGKALGVTKGKAFSSGLVFVNGKYLPPPYVVERWGTGIRINRQTVIPQVIDWSEFLRTQNGAKVVRTEAAPAVEPPPPPPPVPAAAAASAEDDASLDDLFDDDPKPKKKAAPKPRAVPPRTLQPAKPQVSVSYALDGDFIPNEASKALLDRINSLRTDLDRTLRMGGFLCFGDDYSRISGDEPLARKLIERMPELQRGSSSVAAFSAGMRAAGLVYFTDQLLADLFANRIDYPALQKRREDDQRERAWSQMLEKSRRR